MRRGTVRQVPWLAYGGDLERRDDGRRKHQPKDLVWDAARDALLGTAQAAAEVAGQASVSRRREVPEELGAVFLNLADAYEAGLWLYWVTSAEVIAVPRPAVHTDERERLHSADGPAIDWPGGERYYYLHGVEVPTQVVETPAARLDPRLVLFERNADVRREIVRKIGIERICDALGAQCIDRQGDYELLLLDLQDGRERPFLKMKNPSIGVYHVEGVAPDCRTVAEALAWRNGTNAPPSVLT